MFMSVLKGIISRLTGGGGFDPSTITGLTMWQDVSDLDTLFQDSGKTTPVTADGQVVGAWADKSGNGNDATQSNALNRPDYKTTYIDSNGTSDYLISPSILIPDELMVGIHLTIDDPMVGQGSGYLERANIATSGSPYFLITENSGGFRVYIDGNYRWTHGGMTSGDAVRIVVKVTKPASNYLVDCWIDGVKQSQYDAGTALNFVGNTWAWILFSGYPTLGDCKISRFVYYEGTYTDTDAENVDLYLESGWNPTGPTILFLDTFTDTDNTGLASHTPDVGAGWTEIVAGTDPQIIGNVLDSQGTGEWLITGDVAADCVIYAEVKYGNTQNAVGIRFRYQDSNNNWILWFDDSYIRLGRRIGGSSTNTDVTVLGANANRDRWVKIVLSGSSIKIWVDGVQLYDVTDSAHSTIEQHGFRFYRGTNNGLDNYTITDSEYPAIADPTEIDGLMVWLDASDRGSTALTWDDKSGNNNHFVSSQASYFPTFAGGKATFGVGGQDFLTWNGWDATGITSMEVFVILKRDGSASSTGSDSGSFGYFTGGTDHYVYGGQIYNTFFTSTRQTVGLPAINVTASYHVVNIYSANNDFVFNINGGTEYKTTSATFNSAPASNTLALGASAITGGYYFSGDIAAYVLFDHKLTSKERAQVNEYLLDIAAGL